jgi:CMP-N,N'-diacetyllegionaminic acid synthase
MINSKTVLAIIPARGGSKGVPRKNIKPLAGKPLIAWTVEEAKKSKYIDRLVLSSEDEEIIKVAKSYGCEVPFVRPAELAQDETPGIAPVLHALDQLPEYNILILLQPTSPLRTVQDIDRGLEFFERQQAVVCVSVSETTISPYSVFKFAENYVLKRILDKDEMVTRRQDLPIFYVPNGALYIINACYLKEHRSFYTKETLGFSMPMERSRDIDDEVDFAVCEELLVRRFGQK